jgi:glycerol-3-phosphate acyltransferase PlsY
MIEAALFVAAYLLGSIPFGVLFARAKGVDLFSVGSGNVGATNVKRALGLGTALAVFLLDVLKGFLPSFAALKLLGSQDWAIAVGVAAIVGHCFSPFLRFKGGKGVATGLGALFGVTPLVAACVLGVWLAGMLVHRWVSLSSITAVIFAPFFGWLFRDSPGMFVFYALLFFFVLYTHRGNIQRLMAGTEPKFDLKGKTKARDEHSSFSASAGGPLA